MLDKKNNAAGKQVKISEYMDVPTTVEFKESTISALATEPPTLDIPEYIDVPEYVTDRTGGYTLMALGWLAWMWLFMPIIALGLWWFESNLILDHVLRDKAPYHGLTLLELALLITVAFSCLLLWASYNWIRFNGADRRSAPKPIELQQIAQSFELEQQALLDMVQAKHLTLYYDQDGKIEHYAIQEQGIKVSMA